jgi:ceroid-lipofuscinosis neuronal protein 5
VSCTVLQCLTVSVFTGFPAGYFPPIADDDTLDMFILKAPVWEFVVGDILGEFHIIHDAIGFRSHKTGLNYTTEWYELFELFNCTFPHVLAGHSSPLWCNQGATCFYPGINDTHWTQSKYGTLTKVAEVSGKQFNAMTTYWKWDNNTGLYYETWRVRSSAGPKYTEWFNPFECADYVVRVFQKFGEMGVKFTTSYKANYTFITLYCDEPEYLGNDTTIFGSQGNTTLAAELMSFYTLFQAHEPILTFLEHLVEIYYTTAEEKLFYLYYNSAYWRLHMREPFIKITYEHVPFYRPNGTTHTVV